MIIDPKTNLFIATPAFGAQLHTSYVWSLLRTSNMLCAQGLHHTTAFVPGDSLVQRARNVLVAQFMASGADPFMFIDGDIKWEPESILRLLGASQYPEIEVCCGIYPKKSKKPEFPVNFLPGSDKGLIQHPETGYIEIKDAPTGFLVIRRTAFVKMMAAYPELKCTLRPERPDPEEEQYEYSLFNCMIDNGHFLSEDYGFSRLWQRIGGRVWMDPKINLSHFGLMEFDSSISSALVMGKNLRPQFAEQIQGWMTKDELQFLAGAAKNVGSIVEIGSWKGRSTFALLENCEGPVYAVDHWLGSEGEREGPHAEAATTDIFAEFMFNVGHFANLHVVRKGSPEAAAEVPEVDMVWIDGGHRYKDVVADIQAFKGKAKRLICGHDYHDEAVARAVADTLGSVHRGPGSIWIKEVAA